RVARATDTCVAGVAKRLIRLRAVAVASALDAGAGQANGRSTIALRVAEARSTNARGGTNRSRGICAVRVRATCRRTQRANAKRHGFRTVDSGRALSRDTSAFPVACLPKRAVED